MLKERQNSCAKISKVFKLAAQLVYKLAFPCFMSNRCFIIMLKKRRVFAKYLGQPLSCCMYALAAPKQLVYDHAEENTLDLCERCFWVKG